MSLEQAYATLGWPSRNEVLYPTGIGAKIFTKLAADKLGRAIQRLPGGENVKVGVLASDPESTEAPLAIICEFPHAIPSRLLYETQKLAWSFCRSLLLITVEPHQICKWSCCEFPIEAARQTLSSTPSFKALNFDEELAVKGTPEILPRIRFDSESGKCLDEQAADSLQWVELVSGHFFQKQAQRFPLDKRADRMLLSNLKEVRNRLRAGQLSNGTKLSDQYSHDLLGRIIFIQFLFDRKDANNHAALNVEKLHALHNSGILRGEHATFADILTDYEDAYALFKWLNERFNGDLFPGKGKTEEARAAEWREEQAHVRPEHLRLLADFVRGDLEMQNGQKCLWPLYAFDAIPLEFISSIYEEFVSSEEGTGVHYTRGHIVDLMLDRVLPWDIPEWDLRILDPACGSGIFLVKAYQRLIYRWKQAHQEAGVEISANVLRHLLENNLFGVDKEPNAVRVASFSLYLAMCDEIDPRHYWSDEQHVQFPDLRERRLVSSDFFAENMVGIRTEADAETFDLVVGNPPWGDDTMSADAVTWAKHPKHGKWQVANKDFGILFVAKSMSLTKPGGHVCLVQSASALLYNREETALRLQQRVFLSFKAVEGVINLAAFRPFKNVRVPTCVLILRNDLPANEYFWYECPKPLQTSEDFSRITIEAQDVHYLYPHDIVAEPWIWSLYMWGSNRDRNLIRRLRYYPTLERLKAQEDVKTREGVNRGNRLRPEKKLEGRPFIEAGSFNGRLAVRRYANDLDVTSDTHVHSKDTTDIEPFKLPQLVVKQSWIKNVGRFQATFIEADPSHDYVFSSQSFITAHSDKPEIICLLKAASVCYNSDFANYYLLLTNGRFAFDRAEPLVEDLRRLPLPDLEDAKGLDIDNIRSLEQVNKAAANLYNFREAETILIEDLTRYTLPDYKGKADSIGRNHTRRQSQMREPELYAYAETFCNVLRATYGEDKFVGGIIFHEGDEELLPVRLVTIYLNASHMNKVQIEPIGSRSLRNRLTELYKIMHSKEQNTIYQRTCRSYETQNWNGQTAMVVHLIKPDQVRYWTRSAGMRDADAVAADFMQWGTLAQASSLVQSEGAIG